MKTYFYVNNEDISEYILQAKSAMVFESNKLIGNTPSMEMSLNVNNTEGKFNELLDFPFYMKDEEGNTLGIFYVIEKPERMTNELSLTLYDGMIFSNINYETSLVYPTTILSILDEMSELLNVNIDYSVVDTNYLNKEINFYDTTEFIRTHLGWIAEGSGCNVFVNAEGNYQFFSMLNTLQYTIDGEDVEQYDRIENFIYSGIEYKGALTPLFEGNRENQVIQLDDTNPYIDSQEDLTFLHEKLSGLQFVSCKDIKMIAIDGLKCGEIVSLTGLFNFMPLSIEHEYLNATYDIQTISGEFSTKAASSANQATSIQSKMKRIEIRQDQNEGTLSILSQNVDENTNKIANFELNTNEIKSEINDTAIQLNENIDESINAVTTEYTSALNQIKNEIELRVENVETIVDESGEKIKGLETQLAITESVVQITKTTTETLQSAIDGKVSKEELEEYVRFDGAQVEIGMSSSPFKTVITHEELAFYQGSTKVAWLSNNELHIGSAIITTAIGVGCYQFKDEGDLGFSLILV